MRGLTPADPHDGTLAGRGSRTRGGSGELPLRTGFVRTGTAAAGAAAVGLLLAGCSSAGTGVREEGPANSESSPVSPAPSAEAAPARVDPVAILKKDPKVSAEIREGLKPCAPDEYPVDVSYGTLTGNSRPDVVINVLTCGDSFGIGSYVYRGESEDGSGDAGGDGGNGTGSPGISYTNVFTDEQSPVYAEITGGELEISKLIYATGDKVCCPSGEDVITYRWSGDRFAERARTHNDYSKAAGGGAIATERPED